MFIFSQAEIQLGGIDPDSIIGEMQLTTTIQPNDYAVPVHSVRFGSTPPPKRSPVRRRCVQECAV